MLISTITARLSSWFLPSHPNILLEKNAVRNRLINERSCLNEENVLNFSLAIQDKFLESRLYSDSNVIALYASFKGEVLTDKIFEDALSKGIAIVMPRVSRKGLPMEFITVSSGSDLIKSRIGIMEPTPDNNRRVKPEDIDLFVVPGVAYDLYGNRLGMGWGCYDRALKNVSRDSIVGLAYEFQLMDKVPASGHDVQVGWIFTENRFIETSG